MSVYEVHYYRYEREDALAAYEALEEASAEVAAPTEVLDDEIPF